MFAISKFCSKSFFILVVLFTASIIRQNTFVWIFKELNHHFVFVQIIAYSGIDIYVIGTPQLLQK